MFEYCTGHGFLIDGASGQGCLSLAFWSTDLPQKDDGPWWSRHDALPPKNRCLVRLGNGTFLGFLYSHNVSLGNQIINGVWEGPKSEIWGVTVPYWFLLVVFSLLLLFVWRKTGQKKMGQGFPVIMATDKEKA